MEYNKKVIVIGDVGVGKTSFVARVTEGRFITEYKSTVGADCAMKIIKKPNNVTMRISLWDLAGQESFKSLMPMYARGCDGVIIVCDVSNPDTIESISKWKSVADTTLADFKPSILLVNKFDLPKHIHCTTEEQLERLCEECRLSGYYEASVKENINLQPAIDKLSDLLLMKSLKCHQGVGQGSSEFDVTNSVKLYDTGISESYINKSHVRKHYSDHNRCCD